MAGEAVFDNGNAILVTAEGPGKLHFFSWGSAVSHKRTGSVETKREGRSHFVIGFSYSFNDYAFYWEGDGKAEYRTSNDKTKHPVGKSWKQAIAVRLPHNPEPHVYEVPEGELVNVTAHVPDVTCYLLPREF